MIVKESVRRRIMGSNRYVGTQTEKNLLEAFSGESQARNKYTYFASVAKKEGYEQMSALFLKTANNEKEHAKMWFKELAGIGDTKENLAAAAEGENYEWTDMKVLQRLQKKKVFQNLLPNSEQSERLRSIMKKDIVHFLRISRLHKYLKKVK